jgi:DASH complex subunit DAM1
MSELVDEAEALQANVDNLRRLSDSLRSFNESFASWLYVMDMNALTTDWLQAPTDVSFQLARKRAEDDVRAAAEAAKAAPPPATPDPNTIGDADKTTYNETADYETTFTTALTSTSAHTKSAPQKPAPKKKAKAKLTVREKKERIMEIEKIIMCLPLEFRGSDPGLRRNMETVIEAMINSDGRGVKLLELIKPPDLNQARVNKCLIALVNRKIVHKDSASGSVLYHWHGLS